MLSLDKILLEEMEYMDHLALIIDSSEDPILDNIIENYVTENEIMDILFPVSEELEEVINS